MSPSSPSVGLVGVGLLGMSMAQRLIQEGVAVVGFDVDEERLLQLVASGGQAAETASSLIASCDTVLLSLPTSEIVGQVLHAHDEQLRPGQTIVDTTTGNPQQMILQADMLSAKSVCYAEATVAGSSVQMRNGNSVIFLGCDDVTCQRITWLTEALSSRCFHLGGVGAASKFKLVHNLVLGLNRAVLAEGLAFAEALGFSAEQTLQILEETPAASGVMKTKGEKMVHRDFHPQARLSQHLKDVQLILEQADCVGADTPLSRIHAGLLETAERLGFGDADNSAVITAYTQHRKR